MAAQAAGLLDGQTSRIQGRITDSLLAAAKTRSGITSDTELLEYALARVAIEDDFGLNLLTRKGRVPADVDLEFDLALSLRRLKPQRIRTAPARRSDADLPFVGDDPGPGHELLLDTCVYIDVLQGRTPDSVDRLLKLRIINHSSVCLSELTHLFGRLDPADPRTSRVLREIARTIDDIPGHRLTTPSVRAAAEAGILAGLMVRLSASTVGRDHAALNDGLIYTHAIERGFVVLTRNFRDFDLFDQLRPAGSVLFYKGG